MAATLLQCRWSEVTHAERKQQSSTTRIPNCEESQRCAKRPEIQRHTKHHWARMPGRREVHARLHKACPPVSSLQLSFPEGWITTGAPHTNTHTFFIHIKQVSDMLISIEIKKDIFSVFRKRVISQSTTFGVRDNFVKCCTPLLKTQCVCGGIRTFAKSDLHFGIVATC